MAKLELSFNGARLKAARQYNSMTIGEVAEALSVSSQSISQFENNKAEPKLENVFLLSNLLGFPKEYFYEYENTNVTTENKSSAPVEMLTIKECTQAVSGLSEHTVRQLVAQKKIPYIRTGQGKRGKILISKAALLEYLKT